MTEGQTNDFLRDIVELKKRRKSGILSDRKRKAAEDGGEDKDGGGGDEDIKRMKANFDELCDEDKILVFFKKLLNEWNQELNETSEAEKRTAKGKSMVATFKQCARYLNPLFKFCRKKFCCIALLRWCDERSCSYLTMHTILSILQSIWLSDSRMFFLMIFDKHCYCSLNAV